MANTSCTQCRHTHWRKSPCVFFHLQRNPLNQIHTRTVFVSRAVCCMHRCAVVRDTIKISFALKIGYRISIVRRSKSKWAGGWVGDSTMDLPLNKINTMQSSAGWTRSRAWCQLFARTHTLTHNHSSHAQHELFNFEVLASSRTNVYLVLNCW